MIVAGDGGEAAGAWRASALPNRNATMTTPTREPEDDSGVTKPEIWRFVATILALAAVLLVDLATELGLAIGVAYIIPVWIAHAFGRPRVSWIVSAACSIFIIAGFLCSPGDGDAWKAVTNRVLALGAIWGTTVLSVRHQRLLRRQADRRRELDELNHQLQASIEQLTHTRDEQDRRARTLLSITEDLQTERRRLSEENQQRKAAEERYQDLYDNSPEYYASIDADSAIIEHCNQTLARALGQPRYEIIGRPVFDVYHPDCLEAAKRAYFQFFQTGKVENAELQLKRRDGSKIDVILNVSAVRDVAGRIIRSRSVWRDITQLKRAAEALREREKRLEERFRATVESAPTAMVVIDARGRIVLVNAETEKLFRFERSELLGMPVELLVPDRFRGRHPRHRDAFFADPQARRMGAGRNLFGLRKDGSEFPVEIGLNPIQTSEGLLVLSAIVDITERRENEEQIKRYAAELKRSNDELEQFAYSASHDLRAPLHAIDQLAKWTLEDNADKIPQAVRDDLALLRSRVGRMDRLLEDLLLYARVGRQVGTVETFDCNVLVREIIDLLGPPSGFHIDVNELPTLTTHLAPLEKVLRNLINNAIKHHDRADGRIEIHGYKNGTGCEFSVRDDGPGIPDEYRQLVFGMFQTLKSSDKVEGSGMGLAMVKKIVESRGGRVVLESKEGKGATFRFLWVE